jgi:hypothetical protein
MKPSPRPILRVRPAPAPSLHASFCINPKADLSAFPRSLRLALRKEYFHPHATVEPETLAYSTLDVDTAMHKGLLPPDDSFCVNTVDPDMDTDGSAEFNDSCGDEDLYGLTIVEPGEGNIRRWLSGYDVL